MHGRNVKKRLSQAGGMIAAYPVSAIIAYLVVVSAVFLLLPAFDIWVTDLFYAPDGGFFLARAPVLQAIRRSNDIIIPLIVLWLLLQVALKVASPEQPSYVPPNVTLFLLSTLIIGPGLIVNVILKDNWGRPRPRDLAEFGGVDPYVEVWRITGHCARNCSFVSGEASTAIWLMAVVLVVPRAWRVPLFLVTGVYAALLSMNRVVFGGHFLSDVLLSWGLTAVVVLVAYRLVIADPPGWLANERLEARLTRFGRRIRRGAAEDKTE